MSEDDAPDEQVSASVGGTTTAVAEATTTFSTSGQTVTLHAAVSSMAGTVNEGTVTFTVLQGATVIGAAVTSGTVSGGAASADYALPPGTAARTYTIDAAYNPARDFGPSSDNTHDLTVSPAATTTTAAGVTTTFSSLSQSVTLRATVASAAGTVDEGTVTFTVRQGSTVIGTATTSGTVSGGAASASYTLPAATPVGTYVVDAAYQPGPDYTTSTDSAHMVVVAVAVGYYEVASNGAVGSIDAPAEGSMAGQPLNAPMVGIAYDGLTGGYIEAGGRRRGLCVQCAL